MNPTRNRHLKIAVTIAVAAGAAGASAGLRAQRSPTGAIPIGSADLAGVVTSSRGPEAGVWVIAETTDLPTRFGKMVVTDDSGRYLIPELPKATYIPYPMGFFSKNVDGRIDDPNAGWKGRGIWTTTGTRTVFHNEGGTSSRPKVYKVQVRPDPLAR
jgi:hypothetical protein